MSKKMTDLQAPSYSWDDHIKRHEEFRDWLIKEDPLRDVVSPQKVAALLLETNRMIEWLHSNRPLN